LSASGQYSKSITFAATEQSMDSTEGADLAVPQPLNKALPIRLAPKRRGFWPPRPGWGNLWIGALVLALAAIAVAVFQPPLVTTAPARRGEAVDVAYATGVVEFVRQARISPVVTAPILRVYAAEGESVARGALLAQLEDGPARATASQMESEASIARLSAGRTERLFRLDIAARAAWDDARGRRDAAVAAARAARAHLADYAIRAPFAGLVLRRDAEPGDQATASRVLFVIAAPSSLRVTADLDERDVARVAIGQRAIIQADAFPGRTFPARVAELTPQGDSATRTFRLRLALDPDTDLRAGLTVQANIICGQRPDAVLAPTQALRGDVLWVVKNGRAERRTVVRGALGAEMVEIREGLASGETVILRPSDSLRNGGRVRVEASA
jgi:RND family efflux transporter MFP subunit